MAGPPNQEAGLLLVAVERYTWTTAVGYVVGLGKRDEASLSLPARGLPIQHS